jgi:hypothetical protein
VHPQALCACKFVTASPQIVGRALVSHAPAHTQARLPSHLSACYPTMPRPHPAKGGDARIELATSCTRSRNHTTRPITQQFKSVWRTRGSDPKGQGRAGVEPATYRAATNCSTTELTPQPNASCAAHPIHKRDGSRVETSRTRGGRASLLGGAPY